MDKGVFVERTFCMRGRRIKVSAEEGEGVYHCISRTVNGEFLFDDVAKEILRKQLWLVAEYCGVQVLTYTVLSNHFHVMVRVPLPGPISDDELLRRYKLMYPKPTKYQTARLEVIKAQLSTNGPEAVTWRCRQLKLMGDVSSYLKLVKQRFSIWYNRTHHRYGTLWAERFKSVVVQPGRALRTMAAYVELNCVRAGLANDPKDYRFCGYAEAVAGRKSAIEGIEWVCGARWAEAAAGYRIHIFGTGAEPLTSTRRISESALADVMQAGGELPVAQSLLKRLRFFSDSGVLGTKTFVLEWAARLEVRAMKKSREAPEVPFGFYVLRRHRNACKREGASPHGAYA